MADPHGSGTVLSTKAMDVGAFQLLRQDLKLDTKFLGDWRVI